MLISLLWVTVIWRNMRMSPQCGPRLSGDYWRLSQPLAHMATSHPLTNRADSRRVVAEYPRARGSNAKQHLQHHKYIVDCTSGPVCKGILVG
jgi:hypothetical protein